MKHINCLPIFVLIAILSGCATPTPKTALELQSFQRREFETSKDIVFASIVSVLQDSGYIIKTADKDTGLITASSPTENSVFFGSHMKNTDVSAFVEFFGVNRTSARLNFVNVSEFSSGYGMKGKNDKPILDPKVYEAVFNKIEEAIFVRQKAYGQPSHSNVPLPASVSENIYLYLNQKQTGPFSKSEIKGMIDSGKITSKDFYWIEGMKDWKPLTDLKL